MNYGQILPSSGQHYFYFMLHLLKECPVTVKKPAPCQMCTLLKAEDYEREFKTLSSLVSHTLQAHQESSHESYYLPNI